MSRALRHVAYVTAAAAITAACASTQEPSVSVPPNAGVYKIGSPYQIAGIWYYPHEEPDYDETGIASWYGPTFYGKHTANGEIFDANMLSAAHRTLPMPVNVRVTNLDNGHSLVVRVNDRGPFAKGRIIDVSERAAQLLDFYKQGTARVRVTYLGRADLPDGEPQPDRTPPQIASALPPAPAGKVDVGKLDAVPGAPSTAPAAAAPLPAPAPPPEPAELDASLEPTGQVTQMAVPAMTHLYVQAGAFSSYSNARRFQARLSGAGDVNISSIDKNGVRLYRVRMGPFDDLESADAAVSRLTALGNSDTTIVVDQ